jgi:hypothetical protein
MQQSSMHKVARAMLTWPSPDECVFLLKECICSTEQNNSILRGLLVTKTDG